MNTKKVLKEVSERIFTHNECRFDAWLEGGRIIRNVRLEDSIDNPGGGIIIKALFKCKTCSSPLLCTKERRKKNRWAKYY